MKKGYLIALGLILALAIVLPVAGKDFIDQKLVTQADKIFTTMPADFFYCKIGHRGAMAMLVLREWGYTNVRSIRNGLDGWKAANLPVTK